MVSCRKIKNMKNVSEKNLPSSNPFLRLLRLTIIMCQIASRNSVNLVPRVSHLTVPLGRARRDPGLVWSRATSTIENIREGSSAIRQFVMFSFVALRPPLPTMLNESLRTESSNSIHSTYNFHFS